MDKMKEIISLLDAGYSREEINEMLNDPGKEQSPADESAEATESAQESEIAEPEEPAAPVDNSAEIKALADEVKALKQLIQKQNRKAAAVDTIPQETASDVLIRLINPEYGKDGGKIK